MNKSSIVFHDIAFIVGGGATPTAFSTSEQTPRQTVRKATFVWFSSMITCCNALKSCLMSYHSKSLSIVRNCLSRSFLNTSAKKLQNTWPRMVSSRLWYMGRVSTRLFTSRKKLCKALQNFFKTFKSGGFNFEDTHLKDPDRIARLIALVCVAFTWVYLVGIFRNQNVQSIKIKNHGRRVYSIFKFGLIFVAHSLLNPLPIKDFMSCIQILSCTYIKQLMIIQSQVIGPVSM